MELLRKLLARRAVAPAWREIGLAAAAERELGAILGFWQREASDAKGGFWPEWRGGPKRKGASGALLTSRILWTFSAAHWRSPGGGYLDMARAAHADLQRFRDVEHGGLLWSIDARKGRRSARKEIYGQAFGVFGLSEHFRATGDAAALEQAIAIYRLIEQHGRDREQGGYFDSLEADWSGVRANGNPGPKSQNTMLHLMEAYANLLQVWPDPGLRADLVALIELFLDRIVDPSSHHLVMFLTPELEPATDRYSPGHDIEFSWLIVEAARVVGDAALAARVRETALAVAAANLPSIEADGGISYESGPSGIVDPHRAWWVMAEASVGFLNAFELSRDPAYRAAAERCWDYIERYVIDRRGGEWFARVMPGGKPDRRAAKIGFWKCPYHNSRACMEIAGRAGRLHR
ncbi:MAG: N-acyl-D-glucosamine 2-epimerase [Hyphomicrobiales bacterium]|nr:MAG: N-acyl-D-glucosamine 2-epimerase [Hyphomicrobiales bacterium]